MLAFNEMSRTHAPLVLNTSQSNYRLVFGLGWHSLIGQHLTRQARTMAKKMKASHWLYSEESPFVMACASLGGVDKGVTHYSAAQLFALAHPQGLVAGVTALPSQGFWIVAVRDGTVLTRTDRVLDDAKLAYEELHALGDVSVVDFAWDDLLAWADMDMLRSSALKPLPLSLKPMTLIWVAVVLAVGVLGGVGWMRHIDYQTQQQQALARLEQTLDPYQAWEAVHRDYASKTKLAGQLSLFQAVDALTKIPIQRAGWRLVNAHCELSRTDDWECQAEYFRYSHQGTNQSFVDAMPQGWRPVWKPLNGAHAYFSTDAKVSVMSLDRLATVGQQDISLLSSVQLMVPAFSRMAIGQSQGVSLVAPQDIHGTIVKPTHLPVLSSRQIEIEGPLRSISLIKANIGEYFSWRRVSVEYKPDALPSINMSQLIAKLEGVIYALGY